MWDWREGRTGAQGQLASGGTSRDTRKSPQKEQVWLQVSSGGSSKRLGGYVPGLHEAHDHTKALKRQDSEAADNWELLNYEEMWCEQSWGILKLLLE